MSPAVVTSTVIYVNGVSIMILRRILDGNDVVVGVVMGQSQTIHWGLVSTKCL